MTDAKHESAEIRSFLGCARMLQKRKINRMILSVTALTSPSHLAKIHMYQAIRPFSSVYPEAKMR